jgi:LmbE family N-acetylglucosaminyl deacetylase
LVITKRVFIFAHCDDELFCLPLLLEKNSENTLIFLTTLQRHQVSASKMNIREQEALKANRSLNRITNVKTIFFSKEIYDASIHTDFDQDNFRELTRLVLDEKPDELVTLSYEAGHQDHDSVHIITRLISENAQLKLRCFSGYRASVLSPKLFSVLSPITTIDKLVFKRFETISTAIRLIIIYKSQVKTWLGLAPSLLFKYTFCFFYESRNSIKLEPEHVANCFYENRGRANQCEVLKSHQRFIANFTNKR